MFRSWLLEKFRVVGSPEDEGGPAVSSVTGAQTVYEKIGAAEQRKSQTTLSVLDPDIECGEFIIRVDDQIWCDNKPWKRKERIGFIRIFPS